MVVQTYQIISARDRAVTGFAEALSDRVLPIDAELASEVPNEVIGLLFSPKKRSACVIGLRGARGKCGDPRPAAGGQKAAGRQVQISMPFCADSDRLRRGKRIDKKTGEELPSHRDDVNFDRATIHHSGVRGYSRSSAMRQSTGLYRICSQRPVATTRLTAAARWTTLRDR
jgi:hypothetical protein